MARMQVCDICKKPTARIEYKMLLTPTPQSSKGIYSNYTHHCDVGECCASKIKQLFAFRERRTRAQYLADRKKQAGIKATLERKEDAA